MASAVSPNHMQDLVWLLSGLAERVPHTRSVVLLSTDGLLKAVHGLDVDSAEHLAAIASGLFSLARSTGAKFGTNDVVRQVVAELDDTVLFVSAAGFGSALAVLADRQADPSVLGYEMAALIQSVRPLLSTPTRQAGAGPGEAAR
jgi:predicted regulator of Ras-like GTPase activity (Roadblock/LC7/MglB family)